MKAIFSLVLVIVLCCISTSSFAEAFTLRNGITFGDTKEEVLNKETLECSERDDSSVVTKSGTVAGISGSTIHYYFTDEDGLYRVDYEFPSSSLRDIADSNYESVNDGLIRKYGSALGYTGGNCYIITKGVLSGDYLIAYLYKYGDMYGDLRDYDEWALDYDEYHVKIEHCEYYYGAQYSSVTYYHNLSYAMYTDEEYEDAIKEKQGDRDAVDNDL